VDGLEQVGRPGQILNGEFKEQRFARLAFLDLLGDDRIVEVEFLIA
jgi:hypothetical protein